MACTDNTETVELDVVGGVLTADVRIDPDPANALDSNANGLFVTAQNVTGWNESSETWVYASADSPSFAWAVIGDKSGVYAPGMRIRCKQGGGYLYFIVTKVAYDGGSGLTTVTMYGGGGGDTAVPYTLASATITDNAFSTAHAPAGFPLDVTIWMATMTDVANRTQGSPAAGTIYNPGGLSLSVPIGSWELYWAGDCRCFYGSAGGSLTVAATLSTGPATEYDKVFSAYQHMGTSPGSLTRLSVQASRRKPLTLGAKQTFYLNVKTLDGNGTTIGWYAADGGSSIIRARCAYV